MVFYKFIFLVILGREEKCLEAPNTKQDPVKEAWGGG